MLDVHSNVKLRPGDMTHCCNAESSVFSFCFFKINGHASWLTYGPAGCVSQ
jgi:hypothetical protein